MGKIAIQRIIQMATACMIILLLVLASTGLASADKPLEEVRPVHWYLEFEAGRFCDFAFEEEVTGTQTARIFLDEDGNPSYEWYHFQVQREFRNTSNGKSVTGISNTTYYVDLVSGSYWFSGLDIRVTIPGLGKIMIGTGHVMFDEDGQVYFAAGQPFFEDITSFCNYLGG